jgi:hypothetical protein
MLLENFVVTSKCKSHALYNMPTLHASIESDKEIGRDASRVKVV